MIRSMTAFANAERSTPWGTLACELRSVNHRFLELAVRLPDELRVFEPLLRERVGARVTRGKLDLVLRLRAPEGEGGLQVNPVRVRELSALAIELSAQFPGLHTHFTDLVQFPGVLQTQAADPAELQAQALALLDTVLDEFIAAREREGAKLQAAIAERIDGIARIAGDVRTLMPQIRTGQRAKLQARLGDLLQGSSVAVDAGRIEQEFVLWLQKLDVDEELDRLDAHVSEARRVLKLREAVGRRLDFLLQEFNREANTLGSKSVDARSSAAAVELKLLIDQVREQIQNIE
ncbi:YicC/YloC family endoribonuclease [Lysobacter korlensis]|uniref:YicC/YloC family endoribonuclease n=1 Tax=Lysobacter korlensis TaxID=553636 RepID=A0ABV6RK84_9GAMM